MATNNRVKERVVSAPGTGDIDLAGAVDGFITFSEHNFQGYTVEYWIVDGNNFEHGFGTYSAVGLGQIARNDIRETLQIGIYNDNLGGTVPAIPMGADSEVFQSPSQEWIDVLYGPLLASYVEKPEFQTLSSILGSLIVPLDGRYFQVLLTEDTVLNVTASPDSTKEVGSAVVDIVQDDTGWSVSYQPAWLWPDGVPVPIDSTPNSRTRLVLAETPDASIHADASVRATI